MKTITYNPETYVLVPREPTPLQLQNGSEIDLAEETPDAYQEFLRDIYLSMIAAAPQPEPNHNWCAGCSPDNCSGCGAELVDSEPMAWCLAYDDPNLKLRIHSNPTMCEAEIDAHVKGLNGALSKAPLYTTPQPDRTAELEAALKVAKDALEYYVPMLKQGDSTAEEALAKMRKDLK